jgi:predicted lipase
MLHSHLATTHHTLPNPTQPAPRPHPLQVFSLLDQLVADASRGPWQVYVTGHSLGGALATLCAYELCNRAPSKRAHYSVTMYTYGAPRVGNKTFADSFNK